MLQNSKKVPIAVLISGRGSNMQALFEATKIENFPAKIVLVLSNNKEAAGLDFARKNKINFAVVDHHDFKNHQNPREAFEKELDSVIEKSKAKLICLAGFMRILSNWFVKKWEGKIINIHPSLLPSFKGADAVGDALQAGVKITGCTTHFVSAEVDSGEIIKQKAVVVRKNDTKEILARRILKAEHEIYQASVCLVCKAILKEESQT